MKSILQKSNFNPKELLSSFQKDWEILPFPYVVAKPRNLRNGWCIHHRMAADNAEGGSGRTPSHTWYRVKSIIVTFMHVKSIEVTFGFNLRIMKKTLVGAVI